MIKRDLSIGGEQSGHIIFSEHLFTGDGIVHRPECAARDGRKRARAGGPGVGARDLSAGAGQRARAREVGARRACRRSRRPWSASRARLAGEGRLLVRYSGTEPLLRVMIEGKNQQQIQAWAAEIAGAVREHLG